LKGQQITWMMVSQLVMSLYYSIRLYHSPSPVWNVLRGKLANNYSISIPSFEFALFCLWCCSKKCTL